MGALRTAIVVGVAVAMLTGAGTAAAAADPLAPLETSLLKRYPGVAGPLLASSPLKARGLRLIYTIGAVSVWYQTRADRSPTCVAARDDSVALRDAIIARLMPAADDVRFWAARGISPNRAATAFRRGILRACTLRGG